MGPVQPAVLGDSLRFQPDAKLQPLLPDPLSQLRQGAAQLLLIGLPVSQPAVVVIPFPEPAVIHDKQFDSQVRRLPGNLHQPVCRKVKIRGLPVVDQYRPAPVLPHPPAHVFPQGSVEDPADTSGSLAAVSHGHLRQP